MENISHTSKEVVTSNNTAVAIGSGDVPVYATPAMTALMENAAANAAKPLLQDEETTVGYEINVKHIKASAEGREIEATAKLTVREGRKLVFDVEASDNSGIIGMGSHTRYIVNREQFIEKLSKG